MNNLILCEGVDEVGALETVLMNAIEETGKEEKFIVGEAKRYVEELCGSSQLKKYLQHNRQILKLSFLHVSLLLILIGQQLCLIRY